MGSEINRIMSAENDSSSEISSWVSQSELEACLLDSEDHKKKKAKNDVSSNSLLNHFFSRALKTL